MKRILVLAAAMVLALGASAFAASTTGFSQFVYNGNGTMTATTLTGGYYNGGDAFYANGTAGDFIATFKIQSRNIQGGFAWTVGWYVDPSNRNVGQNYNPGGYSALTAYGTSAGDPYGQNLAYYGFSPQLGQDMADGPAMYWPGNLDGGPVAAYTLSCIGGRAKMVWQGVTLFDIASPNTGGFTGFNFLGDGTYTVTDFVYTEVPEPGSIVCLLSGLGVLVGIRRRK